VKESAAQEKLSLILFNKMKFGENSLEKPASQKRSSNTKLANTGSEQYIQVIFYFQVAK
jgi:hypothetical protein